jgi:hypothetical protein
VRGDPVGEGGLGDEQAVRAVVLLVRTARWLNEIVAIIRASSNGCATASRLPVSC